MPRYYFHILEGPVAYADDFGMELPDLAAARAEAVLTLAEMMRHAVAPASARSISLTVRDDRSAVLFVASMQVSISPGGKEAAEFLDEHHAPDGIADTAVR